MSAIIDLIARHHPDTAEAIKLIAALETAMDAANSYAEDLDTGLEQGVYENTECRAELSDLCEALDVLQR